MKLPWNKNYLIISFHIIVTIIILSTIASVMFQLSEAKNVISSTVRNFFTVFSPLFFGIFFSILLNPPTNLFEKYTSKAISNSIISRKIATLLTLLFAIIFIIIFSFFASKGVGGVNLDLLQQQLSSYVEKFGDFLVLINVKFAQLGLLHNIEDILFSITSNFLKFAETSIIKIGSAIPNIGSQFLDIFLGFVISIYFLMEKSAIFEFLNEVSKTFLGNKKTDILKKIFATIYNIFIGYLSGQLIDAFIMAILFSITFSIIGIPYAILLGIFSGFSNIIPYFGSIVAFFLSITFAFLSGDTSKVLYSIIAILLLQQIDSIIIVPRVVGKKVELHPVIVLLSLTVFGRLFGFIGLLLAVPLGALAKTSFFFIFKHYKKT